MLFYLTNIHIIFDMQHALSYWLLSRYNVWCGKALSLIHAAYFTQLPEHL